MINHIHIGSFELSWIYSVLCQMDGFFESFDRHNRTSIGFTDVRVSVTLEHASFLTICRMYELARIFGTRLR